VTVEHPEEPLRRLERLEREVSRLRAELLPERRIEELPEVLDVLVAIVAGRLVALPLDAVLEVIPRVPFVPLPDAPPHMAGHMRWRGAHVPVVDATFLWTGHCLAPRRLEDRVVVVRHGGAPRGLLVPEVPGVDRFRKAEWDAVAAGAGGAELAVALAHRPEGSVLLVSLPHLFAAAPLPAQEPAQEPGEAVP
jgi:chemotaxis signal transduction protein